MINKIAYQTCWIIPSEIFKIEKNQFIISFDAIMKTINLLGANVGKSKNA